VNRGFYRRALLQQLVRNIEPHQQRMIALQCDNATDYGSRPRRRFVPIASPEPAARARIQTQGMLFGCRRERDCVVGVIHGLFRLCRSVASGNVGRTLRHWNDRESDYVVGVDQEGGTPSLESLWVCQPVVSSERKKHVTNSFARG